LIGICDNQAAWDSALERSFYPFISYRYGWLKAWAAGMPNFTPLFIAQLDERGGCDYVCPMYLDSKEKTLTGAVGFTPGFVSGNINPDAAVSHLIRIAQKEGLGKIILQIPPGYGYCNQLLNRGFLLRRKISFYVLPVGCFRNFEEYLAAISNKGKKSDLRFALRAGLRIETSGYSAPTYRRFQAFLAEMATRNHAQLPGEQLYAVLHDHHPDDSLYWLASHDGVDVGSALTFASRDQLWIMWLQGGERYRNLKVDSFLYAEIIRYSIDRGFRVVNFGTSPMDTPLGDFKRRLEAQLEFHEQYELDLKLTGVIKQCGGKLKRYVQSKYTRA
jgi:hypothetical protein